MKYPINILGRRFDQYRDFSQDLTNLATEVTQKIEEITNTGGNTLSGSGIIEAQRTLRTVGDPGNLQTTMFIPYMEYRQVKDEPKFFFTIDRPLYTGGFGGNEPLNVLVVSGIQKLIETAYNAPDEPENSLLTGYYSCAESDANGVKVVKYIDIYDDSTGKIWSETTDSNIGTVDRQILCDFTYDFDSETETINISSQSYQYPALFDSNNQTITLDLGFFTKEGTTPNNPFTIDPEHPIHTEMFMPVYTMTGVPTKVMDVYDKRSLFRAVTDPNASQDDSAYLVGTGAATSMPPSYTPANAYVIENLDANLNIQHLETLQNIYVKGSIGNDFDGDSSNRCKIILFNNNDFTQDTVYRLFLAQSDDGNKEMVIELDGAPLEPENVLKVGGQADMYYDFDTGKWSIELNNPNENAWIRDYYTREEIHELLSSLAAISVTSDDNSILVSKEDNTYDLSLQTKSTRIELTINDFIAWEKYPLDLGKYTSFILTSSIYYLPGWFPFVVTGEVNYDGVYKFSFPKQCQCLQLQDSSGNILLDTGNTCPNGIPQGETLTVIPNRDGQWAVQPQIDIISYDNSIWISKYDNTFNLAVAPKEDPHPVFYAKNAAEFNNGVSYLQARGGGILYLTGRIDLSQLEKMLLGETWTSYDVRENVNNQRLENPRSVINFRNRLDNIQIVGYTASSCFLSYNVIEGKFYTLKGDRLTMRDVTFTRDMPVAYEQYIQTTQPYLICNHHALLSGCLFACDNGSPNELTPPPRPLRNHVWQAGNTPSGYGIDITFLNCRTTTAYFRNANHPFLSQNEIIINITGRNSAQDGSGSCAHRLCCNSVLEIKTDTHRDNYVFRVINNSTKYFGGDYNYFYLICPGMKGVVQQGDFLTATVQTKAFVLSPLATNSLQLYDIREGNSKKLLAIDENGYVQTTKADAGTGVPAKAGFETFPAILGQLYAPLSSNARSLIVRCAPLTGSSIVSLSLSLSLKGTAGSLRLGLFDNSKTLLAQTDLVSIQSLSLGQNTLPLKDNAGKPTAVEITHSEQYYLGLLVDSSANGYMIACLQVSIGASPYQGMACNAVYYSTVATTAFDFNNPYNGTAVNGTFNIPHIQANSI
jgi:hypothetical protein